MLSPATLQREGLQNSTALYKENTKVFLTVIGGSHTIKGILSCSFHGFACICWKKFLQASFWCRSYQFLDLLSQPAHLESKLNADKAVLCQQPIPKHLFSSLTGALQGAAISPHPAVLGGPCSPHWYWCTVRQTFPGVSHIPPDRAAPRQHARAWKGCKASTRKNLGLCQLILD